MEFQITPDVAHLFADATAAYTRSKADTVWLNERSDEWHELWVTFRDADNATVTVSREAGDLMLWVWGDRRVWRDEPARQMVMAHLRPQWQKHVRARLIAR
ncbi:hypothetical protein ACFYW9_19185 [Streptomyces sp. NPDC002698]|uniref:hypothetical protein n=1 Tax=Streptomyces sp. NPDC002698 TaxID=3364660 RepID=UPI0036CBED51